MPNEYDIGDVVRLKGVFSSTNSTALTPTEVTFWVEAPSSTVLALNTGSGSVINPTSGTYYLDVVVTTTGVWKYRIFSTGTGQTAEDDLFRVATPLVSSTGT